MAVCVATGHVAVGCIHDVLYHIWPEMEVGQQCFSVCHVVVFCAGDVPGDGAEEAVSVADNADTPVRCDFSATQLMLHVGIGEAVLDRRLRVRGEDPHTSLRPEVGVCRREQLFARHERVLRGGS